MKGINMKLKTIMMIMLIIMGCSDHKVPDTTHQKADTSFDTILATIDDHEISGNQFQAYLTLKRLSTTDEARRLKIFERYVERAALADAIEKENYLDHHLMAEELNEFRKEMLISRYFEKFLSETVTDQAVQNYYHTHISAYEIQKAHAAHILIRTRQAMSDPERQAKRTIAQEAYAKICSGENFATIARNYSQDNISAKKGGDLGWIKKGSIHPLFSQTLFDLKPGDVSLPVETPFGFHIIQMIEAPKTIRRPLDAVAAEIRYQLRNEAKQAESDRLKKNVRILMNNERGNK